MIFHTRSPIWNDLDLFVVSFGDHDLVFLYLSQSYQSLVGHFITIVHR
jgi:hypothetical protein